RNGEILNAFKFGDKVLESAPEKYVAILGMNTIGGREGHRIINQKRKEINDNLLYNKYFYNTKKKSHAATVDKRSIAATIKEEMTIEKLTRFDDEQLLCLIGFYLCCVMFFGDINASSMNVRYLGLVETLDTVKKVSWPDKINEHLFNKILISENITNVKGCVPYLLILFAEHTEKGTIPKVPNRKTDFPRVGRWNVHEISYFIDKTD
ncbi:hypothetical protein MKX01_040214, partial [Papaver californicum]